MDLSSLGKVVSRFAPLLGTVIAGPAGASIGQLVAHVFGGDVNDPDQLIQSINDDPQAKVKLAEIQSAQTTELQRLLVLGEQNRLANETRQIELNHANTASAREQLTATKSIYPQCLSTIVVVGFFATLYWIAAFKQDQTDHDVLYMMLGVVGSAFGAVINFWLGSSADKIFKLGNK